EDIRDDLVTEVQTCALPISCGVVLTAPSFDYLPHPPLSLVQVDATLGGLAPLVEPLLGSGGIGAFMEARTPPQRLAAALKEGVRSEERRVGKEGRERCTEYA